MSSSFCISGGPERREDLGRCCIVALGKAHNQRHTGRQKSGWLCLHATWIHVGVAQTVEHLPSKQRVAGSIPVTDSMSP